MESELNGDGMVRDTMTTRLIKMLLPTHLPDQDRIDELSRYASVEIIDALGSPLEDYAAFWAAHQSRMYKRNLVPSYNVSLKLTFDDKVQYHKLKLNFELYEIVSEWEETYNALMRWNVVRPT